MVRNGGPEGREDGVSSPRRGSHERRLEVHLLLAEFADPVALGDQSGDVGDRQAALRVQHHLEPRFLVERDLLDPVDAVDLPSSSAASSVLESTPTITV